MSTQKNEKIKGLDILRDRDFMRVFLGIAIPIVIQNIFSTGLNFISNIMIGNVGSTQAIAAIGIANKIYFLYDLFAFGMISGGSIFFAQYYGSRDFRSLRRTVGMILSMVITLSLVFVIMALAMPRQLLGLFSNDPGVLSKGVTYLQSVAISYLFTGISFTLVMVMRAVNDTVRPMFSSIVAILVNVFLQYSLIYGKFGFPYLEVKGAAIATVIARFIEMSLICYFVFRKKSVIHGKVKEFLSFRMENIKKFFSVSLPVVLNEALWGLGTVAYSLAYAKLGTSAYSSTEIGSIVAEMFYIFSLGIAHGSGILIGNSLGADNKVRARKYGTAFVFMATTVGCAVGLLLYLLKNPILALYKLDAITISKANTIIIMNAFLMPIRFLNTVFIIGILRGGGDTKYALMIELIGLWGFGVPATFILVYFFNVGVEVVFFMHFLEETIKTILCIPRYKKEAWLRKVI